jgi:hypothetical protein
MLDWETIHGSLPTITEWSTGEGTSGYPTKGTVVRHWGSFSAAKEVAAKRLSPKTRKMDWTKESALEALKQWKETHDGFCPSSAELTAENGLPGFKTLARLFGSQKDAYRLAGCPNLPLGVTHRAIKRYLPMKTEVQ